MRWIYSAFVSVCVLVLAGSLSTACSMSTAPPTRFRLVADGAELDAVPQVLRLSLEGLDEVPSSNIWLILGELSSVSQSKLRAYEVPQTVASKRVPLASWYEGEKRVIAATELLELGEHYSLVALGYGLLGEIRVSESEEPVLTRVGNGQIARGGFVSYCVGVGARREWTVDSEIMPSDNDDYSAALTGLAEGIAGKYCVRAAAVATLEDLYIPPARVAGNLVSPAAVRIAKSDAAASPLSDTPIDCGSEMPLSLANACVGADDSMLRLSLHRKSAFLELEGPVEEGGPKLVRQMFLQTEKGKLQTWGPLIPETEYLLRIFAFDDESMSSGLLEQQEELAFTSGAPAPRWVLNEVLADPQGAEPAGEWIEIVNAGKAAGSLAGLELWDSSGAVPLPDVKLEAGQFGVLVRPDFDFSEDAIPAADSIRIVVPTLGQNGLKNTGERVELRQQDGKLLSSFPAEAGKAGQSVARLSLWSSDDDATQFLLHGAPGSSPGAENSFDP